MGETSSGVGTGPNNVGRSCQAIVLEESSREDSLLCGENVLIIYSASERWGLGNLPIYVLMMVLMLVGELFILLLHLAYEVRPRLMTHGMAIEVWLNIQLLPSRSDMHVSLIDMASSKGNRIFCFYLGNVSDAPSFWHLL